MVLLSHSLACAGGYYLYSFQAFSSWIGGNGDNECIVLEVLTDVGVRKNVVNVAVEVMWLNPVWKC